MIAPIKLDKTSSFIHAGVASRNGAHFFQENDDKCADSPHHLRLAEGLELEGLLEPPLEKVE